MNGKKHTAKVIKLANAAKTALADTQQPEPPQQQHRPAGMKRKADSTKPPMIGIQGTHYWCFPCSVSGAKTKCLWWDFLSTVKSFFPCKWNCLNKTLFVYSSYGWHWSNPLIINKMWTIIVIGCYATKLQNWSIPIFLVFDLQIQITFKILKSWHIIPNTFLLKQKFISMLNFIRMQWGKWIS